MKVSLKSGLKGYLPLLWYFAFILPLTLLTIFTGSIILRIVFGGSALFVLVIFIRELITRMGLRIELEDGVLSFPVLGENIHWPVDVNDDILHLPGFEFKEDVLVKAPYYDGKGRYNVPLDKLTGVWLHDSMTATPMVVFGTDVFDIQYEVAMFGQEEIEVFLADHFPAGLLEEEIKFSSFVHQQHQQSLERLLKPNMPVIAKISSRKGWIIPLIFGIVFAFFMASSFMSSNRENLLVDALFWMVWIGICLVIFLRLYGEREVKVDKKWVELRVRGNIYKLHWKDVTHFTLQGRLILWGETGRLVIPTELLEANKLLLNMLRVKHFTGELESKPVFMDEFVWNKGSRQ